MLKHYLISGLRNLWRNRAVAAMNILGLAVGIAVVLLSMGHVIRELSFDRFHDKKNDIYRVIVTQEKDGDLSSTSSITAAVAPSLAEEFPEVFHFVRFSNPSDAYFTFDDRNVQIEELTYADSSLFEIFSFSLKQGDPVTALGSPYQVVVTETTARKVFGSEDPLGKVVRLNGAQNLLVTGVMEDFPSDSHLQFSALVSFSSLYLDTNLFLDWNGGWNYMAYIALYPGSDPQRLRNRFPDFMEKHINYLYRRHGFVLHLDLQPLTRIHLFSSRDFGIDEKGDLTGLYIMSCIAFFILLLACINFINLTTALSIGRAREIGLRKVAGATPLNISRQFLFETMMATAVASLVAIILADIFQENFNRFVGSQQGLFDTDIIFLLPVILLLVLTTGLLAGGYPAWYMARFPPLQCIKGTLVSGKGKSKLRNILVVFQFIITLVLVILTLAIFSQNTFMIRKPLGFNRENLIVVPLVSDLARKNQSAVTQAFRSLPMVLQTGASSDIPGSGLTMNGYLPEGLKAPIMINVLDVDESYLELMEIPVIEGRGFDPGENSDRMAFLINETLARQLGWDDAVGKKVYRDGEHPVIGVVADFHFASLHHEIKPLIITKDPWLGFSFVTVRVMPGQSGSMPEKLEAAWRSVMPEEPFSLHYYQDLYREVYTGEKMTGEVILWFSLVAMFIACLGLLGLANFTFNQRRKEVSIRKVLGADSAQLARQISFDFLRLILLAGIIGLPLAWFLAERWLGQFAFKTLLSPWIYVLPLVMLLLLAWLTISIQVGKLANTNLVDALKFE